MILEQAYSIYKIIYKEYEEKYDINIVATWKDYIQGANNVFVNKLICPKGSVYITPSIPILRFPWVGLSFKSFPKIDTINAYISLNKEYVEEDNYFLKPLNSERNLIRLHNLYMVFPIKDTVYRLYSVGGFMLRYDKIYLPLYYIDIPFFSVMVASNNNIEYYGKKDTLLSKYRDHEEILKNWRK